MKISENLTLWHHQLAVKSVQRRSSDWFVILPSHYGNKREGGNPGAVAYCKKSRTPLFYFQFSPDEGISSKVESTTVHCLFLEAGCTWEGKLKESESHVGSCSLASIQRGEQKECESDETLSNKTDDKRESLLSDSVVEDSHTQRPMPANCQEAQNHPPTRETAACPEFGVGADFSEHVTRDGVRKSETRRSRREQSSAKVVKNYSLTRGTGDCHEGGISVCRADRPGDFKEERARRIETRRSCNERGSADVMEKGQINANLPRQVNFLLSGNMAGQNKNSTKNSLELKEEMNPSLNDTITRNTASPRISAPNVSDQHEQRLIDLENQVAYLTHCFSNRYQVTNDIAIVIQHLVSENDQLKNTVRDINNRVNQIQVHLNSHQANFNTLRNERSNQREELVRIQERIRRLEEHANAQETMLRNVSDSIRGLATLTRSRDIENL